MKLYNYYRSSASFRVRIALALKGLAYEYQAVNLLEGEHLQDAFRSQSPDNEYQSHPQCINNNVNGNRRARSSERPVTGKGEDDGSSLKGDADDLGRAGRGDERADRGLQ